MPFVQDQSEAMIARLLQPNLEAQGFRVFVQPSRAILPPFMQGYQPDAIAVREDRNVAIEVTTNRRVKRSAPPLDQVQKMFAAHPDWELRIIYAPTENGDPMIAVVPHERVVEALDRLQETYDTAGPVPALLTGWSVFEAAAVRQLGSRWTEAAHGNLDVAVPREQLATLVEVTHKLLEYATSDA